MKILDLKGGHVLIDENDWPAVSRLAVYVGSNGYAYYSTWANGKSSPATLHGFLMGHHPGRHIDHINGNKLDNRRVNLRVVSPQTNQVNRKHLNSNSTSGHRGVTARQTLTAGTRWIAQIGVSGRYVYLGSFSELDDAVAARRDAELLYFGELCPCE